MRLLLTGANGFTGIHLANAARIAGYEVFPLQADLTDANALLAEVIRIAPTHVIHLAGISAVTHTDEREFYAVNLFGTLNLLNALSDSKIKIQKIILASSANVYGNAKSTPISEDFCPAPVNHYAMSKLAMEYMARQHLANLPIIFTRPFNYTGVGHDVRFVIPKIIEHFKANASVIELGNITVQREYNDVRNVSEIYLALLKHGQVGELFNICSGRTVSLNQVLQSLHQLTGCEMEVKVNPSFIRKNEIETLAGSPGKLENCIGKIDWIPLEDTLSWMLRGD